MNWRDGASIVVGLMSCGCVVPYIRDVLAGNTRPQRMSWLVFASLSIAASVAQFAANGFSSGALLTTGAAVGFGTVSVLSIRYGVGGFSPIDLISIVGLIGVIIVWTRVDNETFVICLIILIEVPAIAVTGRKALRDPASETMSTWIIDGAAGVGAVASARSLTFTLVAYPIFHAAANMSVVSAIALGTRARRPASNPGEGTCPSVTGSDGQGRSDTAQR